MAVTPSTMLPLGTQLPEFSLPDVTSGEMVASEALRAQVTVVTFICNHCPYVIHIRNELAAFGRECRQKGVAFLAISANDVSTHPQDGPGPMAKEAKAHGYLFPYLFDETQDVAKAFRAAATPEFYVFDREGKLAYRGQFDDSRPSNGVAVTGGSLRAAVDALLAGRAPDPDQRPSIGCNIKWKPGQTPNY